MGRKRRTFTAEFKFQVVVELLTPEGFSVTQHQAEELGSIVIETGVGTNPTPSAVPSLGVYDVASQCC